MDDQSNQKPDQPYPVKLSEFRELRRREAHLRTIFNSSAIGIALIDRRHKFVEFNSRFLSMLGYNDVEIRGRSLMDVTAPEDYSHHRDVLDRLSHGFPAPAQFEKYYLRKDGSLLPARITVSLIEGAGDDEAYAVAVLEDITDRKLAEMRERKAKEDLAQSYEQLQVIFANVADGIMVQDTAFQIIFVNRAAAILCGYESADEMMNATLQQTQQRFEMQTESGENFPYDELPARKALRGVIDPPEAIIQLRNKLTGRRSFSSATARAILDGEGKPRLAVTIFRDVSAHKQVEAQFRTLVESLPMLAWVADADGTMSWSNRPFKILRSESEPILLASEAHERKALILMDEGEPRPHQIRLVPVRDSQGRVRGWWGTGTEIGIDG